MQFKKDLLIFYLHRSLWNMRNYIHVMLCANLFAAQLVFVVGVERTENKVLRRLQAKWQYLIFLTVDCLFSHCCVATLYVAGCVHVDVDGGCVLVYCTCESIHYSYWTIHCLLHHHKLWLVVTAWVLVLSICVSNFSLLRSSSCLHGCGGTHWFPSQHWWYW